VLRCLMRALDRMPGVPDGWVGRKVEQASFDDFYVRLPESMQGDTVEAWAALIRSDIRSETSLRCSIGIGRTKLLSMLATKRAKPDGLHQCEGVTAERALLNEARVDALRGAGLIGLPPATRTALLSLHGAECTLGAVREWLEGGEGGASSTEAATALGEASLAAVRQVLERGCDGAQVGCFVLPRSISVECAVRPSDTEPATTISQIADGYARLAPMLLSRAAEDEATYGVRSPAHLVVKWKLYPGASEVRQAQVAWPRLERRAVAAGETRSTSPAPAAVIIPMDEWGGEEAQYEVDDKEEVDPFGRAHQADQGTADDDDTTALLAQTVATLATETFRKATLGKPFRVSRVVLVLKYAEHGPSGSPSSVTAGKRSVQTGGMAAAPDPKQPKIGDLFCRRNGS
jgi:hypothetical protein